MIFACIFAWALSSLDSSLRCSCSIHSCAVHTINIYLTLIDRLWLISWSRSNVFKSFIQLCIWLSPPFEFESDVSGVVTIFRYDEDLKECVFEHSVHRLSVSVSCSFAIFFFGSFSNEAHEIGLVCCSVISLLSLGLVKLRRLCRLGNGRMSSGRSWI